MNIIRSTASLLAVFGLSSSLPAQVLMLDFGPTATAEGSFTNSPYHTAGGSVSHDTWNQVQTVGVDAGGLVWSNGDTASGVAVDLGARGDATKTLDLSLGPDSSLALGGATSTGAYAGTSAGTDAVFRSGTTTSVGLQVTGLTAGNYDIYIVSRNTNRTGTQTPSLFVGTAGSAAAGVNFNFTAYENKTLSFANGTQYSAAWVEGENYVKFSVTLTSGDVLNIAAQSGGGENRGFLNAVQIVNTSTIPEPSTYAAIFGGLALVGVVAIRRRR